MLLSDFCGGLGNLMFQCASIYGLAKQTGHAYGLHNIPLPPAKHSRMDYRQSILAPWMQFQTRAATTSEYWEPNRAWDISELCGRSGVIRMKGYWQRSSYIEPHKEEILQLFALNRDVVARPAYADYDDAYFLHVRRGDYVGNRYHELPMEGYYQRAIDRISGGIAYVVSNDPAWCESWQRMADVRHLVVRENEVDTLSLMAACGRGGVAANSSFSWWGLYLNGERPHMYIPERYFPTHISVYDGGYDFAGTVRLAL
jgi:hypothetical protein